MDKVILNKIKMTNKLTKTDSKRILQLLKKYKKEKEGVTARIIQGTHAPFSLYPVGAYSYPGPDITYTPAYSTASAVCLGCLNNTTPLSNLNSLSIIQPQSQTPSNFATGSTGSLFANIQTGERSTFGNYNITPWGYTTEREPTTSISTYYITNNDQDNSGQPIFTRQGHSTPFQTTNFMNDGMYWYQKWYNSGWQEIRLSQEGILWTLWPLAKPSKRPEPDSKDLYFDSFTFGTAKISNYRLGQYGFFYDSNNQGCIPLGSDESQTGYIDPFTAARYGGYGLPPLTGGIGRGLQGFNTSLTISTVQNLTILVVKVTEQIARIPNPISGISNNERFIYVGYDGWAVVRTTSNPVNPMAAQTYISPQTVTGSIVENNYHVILPPNFVSSVLYKNGSRIVPTGTRYGLFQADSNTAIEPLGVY